MPQKARHEWATRAFLGHLCERSRIFDRRPTRAGGRRRPAHISNARCGAPRKWWLEAARLLCDFDVEEGDGFAGFYEDLVGGVGGYVEDVAFGHLVFLAADDGGAASFAFGFEGGVGDGAAGDDGRFAFGDDDEVGTVRVHFGDAALGLYVELDDVVAVGFEIAIAGALGVFRGFGDELLGAGG